ncbi:MAG: MBL fold metallo-hydrolase [Prolixibacteraceae bacterium]
MKKTMVEICAIASGSNGNCYYIGNEREAILVDAGISCKQLLERMAVRELDPTKLKAIFITHEHVDHIRGTRVLSKKLNIPAFFTYGTWNNAHKSSKPLHYRFVHIDQALQLGEITIHPFAKNHDASEPVSFRIEIDQVNVGVMTDIGSVCENVIHHLKMCQAVFLESNYDEKMLMEGPYPWPLKKRVASAMGHLSNLQALELVTEHAGENLKLVLLSHLSGENNTPEIAYETFRPLHDKYEIINTSRHEASEVKLIS